MSDLREIQKPTPVSAIKVYAENFKGSITGEAFNDLFEYISEKEAEIERLKDNLYKAIEALKTVIYHPRSHAYVRVIADNALTYTKEGETDATQTSSRS